ncbi:c-type cytochrome [Methylorubrum extorquens]|uniref:c-type cytochrome n=1 Tax=Methylorubrum extorquens TaxID=408 RepID=UPI000158F325|nr:c-type cytochrome [Methylorubrum extorquens]ABY28520.1 hypothetical protein Mext_0092 [Methylorubrum extorquens PA1]WIU39912.1 c-type cytochrome [Methylorubrum extorquens]WIU39974.1 c-type cytochrome [Methylorubrum extorquens]
MQRRSWIATTVVVLILITAGGIGALWSLRQTQKSEFIKRLTGGDPARAPTLMIKYGCASCHDIPDLHGPSGRVGPSLHALSERVYIGGVTTNTPENLVRWITNPKALSPRTAMPVTGISEAQARDVAAYLYVHQ